MTSKVQEYVDRWNALADRLIRDRYLTIPELLQLNMLGVLISCAGELDPTLSGLVDPDKITRCAEVVKAMREDVIASKQQERTWN